MKGHVLIVLTCFLFSICTSDVDFNTNGYPSSSNLWASSTSQPFGLSTTTSRAYDLTTSTSTFQPPRSNSTGQYCDSQYSCLSCTSARVCAPSSDGRSLQEINRFTCPSSTPYCNPDTGTCTSQNSKLCAVRTSNFTCMRDGYFPDLTDCSKYYLCQDRVPYMYTCLGSTPYYYPGSQTCVSYSYRCANYYTNCQGRSGVKLLIAQSPNNLYAYCVNNTVVSIDRCIGAYQFNQNLQKCVPYCPHAGLFLRDDGDCSNYYKCSSVTGSPDDYQFVMTNLTCPAGQGFLESAHQCVSRSLVPNCNVPNPGLFNKK